MEENYHIPVLLEQSVDGLNIKDGGVYVDLTFGGGGHSREILKRMKGGKLVVFDQDEDAWKNCPNDDRIIFVKHNFKYISNFLRYHQINEVDGILGDLGVSSHHFDAAERGFSFRFDADLDMRMNQKTQLKASDILNDYATDDLFRIFKNYGEIKKAGQLVWRIEGQRANQPFSTTGDLKEIAAQMAGRKEENKFLSKVFQALRIEVNNEMEALRTVLMQSTHFIKKGGRLSVISYHSLEDRMVKNFIKTGNPDESQAETDIYGNIDTPFVAVNRKVIVPSDEEIEINNRARSAKLRIAERV